MSVKLGFLVSEVIKKGHVSENAVQLLREWLIGTNLPQLTDEQLALFLISTDNDNDNCKKTIEVYFKHKMSCTAIFNNRNVANMQNIVNLVNIAVMPEKYRGCSILISYLNDTNYRNYEFEGAIKLSCMVFESIIYDNNPQELIQIIDCRGSTLLHLLKFKVHIMAMYVDYLQHGVPLKTKIIHYINANRAIYGGYNLIKHFISQDLSSKVVFHSVADSVENFHTNWVPKRYLPQELGGDLGPMRTYHQNTMQKLRELTSYFEAEEQQRVIKNN